MTLQDELNRAESRWLEAERNGTHYDAVYWRGVMDGIKVFRLKRPSTVMSWRK